MCMRYMPLDVKQQTYNQPIKLTYWLILNDTFCFHTIGDWTTIFRTGDEHAYHWTSLQRVLYRDD